MDLCWQSNVSAFYYAARLVIAFLPRSKCLLISWLQSPSAVIWEPLSLSPLFPHLFAMKWWDQMPWSSFSECWVLSQLFHSPLSLSSRLFSSSSLSAIMVVSSAYLRLLIFVSAILIPACASSSLAFHVMYYSAYLDFPGGSQGKESTCNGGDLGLILKLGRSPGGEHGNPL